MKLWLESKINKAITILFLLALFSFEFIKNTTGVLAQTISPQSITTFSVQPQSKVASVLIPLGENEAGRDDAYFAIMPGAINQFTEVKVKVSSTPATTYPDNETFRKLYPAGNVVPIGPLIIFELPYAALTMSSNDAREILSVVPGIYEDVEMDEYAELGVEVRIQRADGTENFYLDYYAEGGFVDFYRDTFKKAYGDNPPATIKVSVQPIDYLGVTKLTSRD
jgi:hypothetical protein